MSKVAKALFRPLVRVLRVVKFDLKTMETEFHASKSLRPIVTVRRSKFATVRLLLKGAATTPNLDTLD